MKSGNQMSLDDIRLDHDEVATDDLLLMLNNQIDAFEELSRNGIYDKRVNSIIADTIKALYANHHIDNSRLKKQRYIGMLIEKYDDLSKGLERSDATGGYGTQRITDEMSKIDTILGIFGIDNRGNLLRSISEIKESTKGKISEQLP